MTVTIQIDDDTPILVELIEASPQRGEQNVSRSFDDLFDKSSIAINNAMATIYGMSKRIVNTVKAIPLIERPDEVEIEFGLALKTDANAFVVKAGAEAQINVTLKWQRQNEDEKGKARK
jgi:hypothetical protein